MAKKEYIKSEVTRAARPRSERLRSLGLQTSGGGGTTSAGGLASMYLETLRSRIDTHAKDTTVHVTADEKSLWNSLASLFELVNIGTEASPLMAIKAKYGLFSNSFISARGSDPEAGQGGGGGLDVQAVWYALAQPTNEKINVSHIPLLQQLSGTLTNAQLANSAITVAGVSVSLGGAVTTEQIASALTGSDYKLTDTIYTLPKATVLALGGIKAAGVRTSAITTTQGGTTSGRYYGEELDSNGKAFVNVPWVNTTYSLSSFGITATAAEINRLDGITASTAELNFVDGVTSNIQTQLNAKANASALTAYALKDGSNASGTWPISVSGIANRAVYLTSTYTGSGGLQPPSYFNGMGLKVNMMNKPVSYCDVIFVNGYGGQGADVPYVNALAFQKTANAHGEVYHARGDYGGSSWGTWYKFLDEYNYAGILDSRYVKKSGDTMSGALTISTSGCPLYIQGGSSAESYLKVRLGGTDKSAFGYSSSFGTYLYSYTYGGYLSLTDSGLARIYKGSSLVGTLWHSGNDGSESGLDADLLDGYQSTSFNLATNLGACEDYGVYVIGLMQITDYTTAGNMANGTLIFIRQNGNNPAQKIIYSLSTQHGSNNVRFGYLTLSTNIYVRPCTFTYNGKKWAGFQVSSASSYSSGVVCVRDGLRLGERSTPFLLKYGVSNTGAVINSEVNSSVVINGADIIESGVHSNAFFGNASSATKLATARSIWGQTFDGTQGVDGHLYLGSKTYRLYFGTSGLTSYITGEDSGYLSIKSANNTSVVATLLRINLSNGVVSGSSISLSSNLAVSGSEGRGITYTGNHIRLKAATGGWAMGIEPYHNDDTTSFSHSVGGAYGGNANTINYTYYGGTYNSPAMVILPNKMVGIGTVTPTEKLHVVGSIRATTGVYSNGYVSAKGQDTTSDARYKRDVASLPAQAALAVLMRLRPSTWAWKDDGRRGAGFIAQEVMGVLPEAVREVGGGEDRHLALNYQMLHAYEVSALQTHETELERLRGRVLLLENEIKRIRHGS